MINYGVVYPQAILVFTVTLLYSIVQPLILIFGAIYFGMAYMVYKYKLLFGSSTCFQSPLHTKREMLSVFYKPYESQGQAWPITFTRLIWAVVIFLVFMTGIALLRESFVIAGFLSVLLGTSVIWSWYIDRMFKPLSKYVGLSSVCEVQRGEEAAELTKLKMGHPVTWSQRYVFE
jgi:TRAP-type C4-dicarboxylate transport system permease large subunit